MNEVYSCLLLPMCDLYEMQNQIFQHIIEPCDISQQSRTQCTQILNIMKHNLTGDYAWRPRIILGGPGSPIAIGPRHYPKLELTGDLEEEREEIIISQAWL